MDDEDCCNFCCCLFIVVVISLAISVPCHIYGSKCKTTELRAHNNTELCKNIHNDESAMALIAFGWIFFTPFVTAPFACVCVLPCCWFYSILNSPLVHIATPTINNRLWSAWFPCHWRQGHSSVFYVALYFYVMTVGFHVCIMGTITLN